MRRKHDGKIYFPHYEETWLANTLFAMVKSMQETGRLYYVEWNGKFYYSDEIKIDGNLVWCEKKMTEQEMDMFEDMFEEIPFDKVDKAEFANAIAQETAEDIISDLKNYIAEYGHITKDMLDELIERYVSHYGVEVEDD